MEQFSFTNGRVYTVDHSRKGKFTLLVTSQTDEWVTGTIVDGTAKAMLDYNVREVGEEVTLRRSFIRSASELEATHEATR